MVSDDLPVAQVTIANRHKVPCPIQSDRAHTAWRQDEDVLGTWRQHGPGDRLARVQLYFDALDFDIWLRRAQCCFWRLVQQAAVGPPVAWVIHVGRCFCAAPSGQWSELRHTCA